MKHKKIEKTILNFFRLLPILCLVIFIFYICMTGFKKEKSNTYDTTNVEQITEEDTIYTYELDDVTIDSRENVYMSSNNWQDLTKTWLSDSSSYDNHAIFQYYDVSLSEIRYLYLYYYNNDLVYTTDGVYETDISEIRSWLPLNAFSSYQELYTDFELNETGGDFKYNNLLYYSIGSIVTYTDNYTIVNKIKYYMNDYVFMYTDSLFNGSAIAPFNAFVNACNINSYSIFYSYIKFTYLYLIYILLLDIIYLFYNIVAFIPKWLLNEFEKRA